VDTGGDDEMAEENTDGSHDTGGSLGDTVVSSCSAQSVKQVIIIRKDLHMRRGKEIAQGSHASIAWLTERLCEPVPAAEGFTGVWVEAKLSDAEWEWVQGNFRKICVVVNSEEELRKVYQDAKDAGLVAEIIEDTGLTEFGGVATLTAVAIGPDYDEKIDPVTGHLALY
jgi:peptidyl-tRNA hydrolase, PTH2 family